MDKEPLIKFIRDTISSFNFPVSRQVLEDISSYYEPKSFDKYELFVTEGKIAAANFFMTEGFMRSFTYNLEGEEVTTHFFYKNGPVFEGLSLYTKARSMENIQAITECRGFLLSVDNLNMLFHSVPEFREFVRAMLVTEFVAHK